MNVLFKKKNIHQNLLIFVYLKKKEIRSIALNGLVILSVKSPSLVRKSDQFK